MQMRWLAVPVLMAVGSAALAASCPPLLEGQLPKLRAKESIDLCQRFAGKPLVIVNTASFCGFAPQFKGLEALYQRYKGDGLEVIGVPSDDFKQEAKRGPMRCTCSRCWRSRPTRRRSGISTSTWWIGRAR
jgi:glutathione peroxidase